MAESRKEERDRLRQQRLASERSSGGPDRRRLYAGYFVAGLLTLAVVVGLGLAIAGGGSSSTAEGICANAHVQAQSGSFDGLDGDCREGTAPPEIQQGDLVLAAKEAGCVLRQDLPDEGSAHIPDTEDFTYKTNPSTSGNHNPNPIADGAYTTPLTDNLKTSPNVRNFVHSMEHGRIKIQYSSDLPEEDQLAIKGIFDESPDGMLMYPNDEMPYEVAATAWTQLLGCPKFSPAALDAIQDFRDAYRGHGPESGIPISL
ncbi:MAG: DUF3105 domain-containing protein [Solirubrobacterales bacterium]|nr:DUF3105 domain-containing protein [Solirubrobacterales bacterium]